MMTGRPVRFQGAFATYQQALEAAKRRGMAGYDHEGVADVAFDVMCQLVPWDYPVLFWISRLQSEIGSVLDAGGHMGTKYRAFRRIYPPTDQLHWTVYDLPAIVRIGEKRALAEGLGALSFTSHLDKGRSYDLFLGSGLLQYLDVPLPDLIARLETPPRHLILNKVALREGRTIVTLERIGPALVPYQMRNESAFLSMISAMGYEIRDRWKIPSLSHAIDTHPEHGMSESAGFYCKLR
ncbi:methyltransferase, TIGR04325 family [Nitratireductor sp. GISD-1A_MAKvit]|uniref:methyltransferase, TIGR04325 family n=1 Tax=Nitratireductor sp. GISD-1A_MAKvit TaxID=3234198 RepID=UPI003465C3EA